MFENILANVIGGLVVAVLFEWLRSRRTAPTVRLPEGAPADIVRGADPWARAREFLRIVLSLVIGFVLSAVIAGFLHGASKHQIDIRSGERRCSCLWISARHLPGSRLPRFPGAETSLRSLQRRSHRRGIAAS
jgi:hypothetical protein